MEHPHHHQGEEELERLRGEVEALRAEAARLRRSGVEAVAAYMRKKERCDELMETLVELQARYDALLLSNPATAGAAGASDSAARVAELEAALQEKEGRLKAAEEEAAVLRQQLAAAAATNASSSERPAASATAAATEAGASLLLSPDPSAEGQQSGKGAGGELSGAVRSLLDDLARLRDFSGVELAATREALEEEGQEKAQALQGQLDGVKGELARAQALMEEVKAQAADQAARDSQTIQELEVTVQLTEGALQMAKQQQEEAEQRAAHAQAQATATQEAAAARATVEAAQAAAALEKEEELRERARGEEARAAQEAAAAARAETGRLQAAMDALRCELSQAEARAAAAEEGRAALTAEVEGMESRLQEAQARAAEGEREAAQAGLVSGELRRLQAELRATKARLDTAQTNQTLLQRYIAVRRLSAGGEGKENAAPPVLAEGKGEKPAAAAPGGGEANGGVVLHASYLMPTH